MNAIIAAQIRDVDLDAIADRAAAQEIARIGALMHRGEESPEEFRRLCELLHEVGEATVSEYLLRRNLDSDEGQDLYQRLFGTDIPDNFARAVMCFAEDFGLDLTLQEERDFLDQVYLSTPLSREHSRFSILNEPCVIHFDYSRKDYVVAEVIAAEAELVNYFDLNVCLFLRWQDQRWRLMDPRDA